MAEEVSDDSMRRGRQEDDGALAVDRNWTDDRVDGLFTIDAGDVTRGGTINANFLAVDGCGFDVTALRIDPALDGRTLLINSDVCTP